VRWRHLIDNFRTQFVPRVLVKCNQKTPLPTKLVEAQCQAGIRSNNPKVCIGNGTPNKDTADQQMLETNALRSHLDAMGVGKQEESFTLPHPYEEELNALTWADKFFQTATPEYFLRMEDTPLVLVKEESDLRSMIEEIKSTCTGKEIAVDVEHHDFRSYRGFVCLVQISTRQKDFVVDPFNIFPQMHMLNEIFTDPNILKVLHGANRDVLWLERDFSVYIVNMFDTGIATRTLRLQGGFSLANLVRHFCGVKLDKKYQTADWRERPLPLEMIQYARSDTHYLLYCFDCIKNALLIQNTACNPSITHGNNSLQVTDTGLQALNVVLESSTGLCRLQYSESPLDSANLAIKVCERFGSKQRPLDSQQFNALQSLIEWRDRLARNLDESWNYIVPDTCLWRITLAMPSSSFRLHSTCNPLPSTLQEHAHEVVELVNRCLENKPTQGSSPAVASVSVPKKFQSTITESPCPHESTPNMVNSTQFLSTTQGPQWPTRTATTLRPVVHVTASDRQYVSADSHHAILDTMVDFESSEQKQGNVKSSCLYNRVACFATKAPISDICNLAEAAIGTKAQLSGECGSEKNVMPSQQNKMVPESAKTDIEAEHVITRNLDTSLMPTLPRRKRRRANTRYECLEEVAKTVITDPYMPLGVIDVDVPSKILIAPDSDPGRRKKAKCMNEQIFIDPYV